MISIRGVAECSTATQQIYEALQAQGPISAPSSCAAIGATQCIAGLPKLPNLLFGQAIGAPMPAF